MGLQLMRLFHRWDPRPGLFVPRIREAFERRDLSNLDYGFGA